MHQTIPGPWTSWQISLWTAGQSQTLNVLDDFNREGLCIDVDFSRPAERVVRSLNQIIEWRGKPQTIGVDKGPEYISGTLMAWAENAAFA